MNIASSTAASILAAGIDNNDDDAIIFLHLIACGSGIIKGKYSEGKSEYVAMKRKRDE